MKQPFFCEIKVHDGEKLLFERQVPVGQIGERRLKDLLQALVVKYALTPEQIVDGHLKRNARGYRPLPEVHQDGGVQRFQLLCFDGVDAVARVVER